MIEYFRGCYQCVVAYSVPSEFFVLELAKCSREFLLSSLCLVLCAAYVVRLFVVEKALILSAFSGAGMLRTCARL